MMLNDENTQDEHEKCEANGFSCAVEVIKVLDIDLEYTKLLLEDVCNDCGYREQYTKEFKLTEVEEE